MNFLQRLYTRYKQWRHKNTRNALQDAAESSDGFDEMLDELDEDDRVELKDD